MKLVKLTLSKLILLVCLSLLSNEIIPQGWKATNFAKEKTKKSKKNDKNENHQKNLKNEKPNKYYTGGGTLGTLEDKCLWEFTCNSEINMRIINSMYLWSTDAKTRNSKMKAYNGNGRTCVNIMHWNLGPRRWDNKRDDVQLVVDQF